MSFFHIMPQGGSDSDTRDRDEVKKKEEHVVADCTRSPNSLPSDYPPDDHKQQYNMQTPFNQLKKPKNNRFPSQGPFRPDKLCKK
jgi:hypothetical protein